MNTPARSLASAAAALALAACDPGPLVDGAEPHALLAATPLWTSVGGQAAAEFAQQVQSAGDVNGDGFDDVLVGAWLLDDLDADEGGAFLFLGGPGGPSAAEDWSFVSGQEDGWLGLDLAGIGDHDGDGYSDVVIGARYFDDEDTGQVDTGKVWLFGGSSTGLSPTPDWELLGWQGGMQFGGGVTGAGDINGDGYADAVVGATQYTLNFADEGAIFVFHGDPSGFGSTYDQFSPGGQAGVNFGRTVAGLGDVNHDGFDDVIAGAPAWTSGQTDEGAAFLYTGSVGGLNYASWVFDTDQSTAGQGLNVGPAGDVDGDGYADFLISTWAWDEGLDTDNGKVWLFNGSSGTPSTTPSWSLVGTQAQEFVGTCIGTAGDVDGDGFSDLLLGASGYDGSVTDEGAARVFTGSPSGPGTVAAWTAEGGQNDSYFGNSCAGAGDVDGDGLGDAAIGAQLFDGSLIDEGAAYVYVGLAEGLSAVANFTNTGSQGGMEFGAAVASAGDMDGDGDLETVVGAPSFTNTFFGEGVVFVYEGKPDGPPPTPVLTAYGGSGGADFGRAVAGGGDVDGDGYDDLVVGAPGYTDGQSDEGRVSLFLGSSGGPSVSAPWTWQPDSAGAEVGAAVALAGDVDGDGFADLAVGAPGQDGVGNAHVFFGSASGLGSAPDWTSSGSSISGVEFGAAVAWAGDVDGDGTDDLLVGSPSYGNVLEEQGAAYLYPGSSAGPTTASMSVIGSVGSSGLGSALAGGDVDGDGYSDLIVGVPGGSVIHGGGEVLVYLGGPALDSIPEYTLFSTALGYGQFGTSVAIGDVNRDGYGDIGVGVPDALGADGALALYLGSSAGPAALPASVIAGDSSTDQQLGLALAFSDIDGDRSSDLIGGAPSHVSQTGRARFFRGTGADSDDTHPVPARTRAERTDGTVIALGARSDDPNGFTAVAEGRGAHGRTDLRLQVEVKPLGVPFDGTDLTTGSPADTGVNGVELSEALSGLTSDTEYHWRARTGAPPYRARAQSWGPWSYGGRLGDATGIHLRTACVVDADLDGVCDAVEIDDQDGDGFSPPADCDDFDADVHPGAAESCDAVDSDCDGDLVDGFTNTDGDSEPNCVDLDDDNDGDPDASDCDDLDDTIYTGATEACDAVDSDCDGSLVDQFTDTDGDGTPDCTDDDDDGDGEADIDDCAPLDATRYTGAPESCDAIDSDCDGSLVDGFPDTDGDGTPNCTDTDDDGDGDPDTTDCNDVDDAIYTGAPEACDGIDSDCDGSLVDGFPDSDGDGTPDCVDVDLDGDGWDEGLDCNDANASIFPGATEACDTIDSDCDGSLVDGFADTDGNEVPNCTDPDDDGDGSDDVDDCAPLDPAVYPGAVEACDTVDSDCDGSLVDGFADTDGDSTPDCVDDDDDGDGDPDSSDCGPLDPAIYSGAPEACDTLDSDCDGGVVDQFPDTDGDQDPDCTDPDDDGDGVADGGDCGPLDGSVYPGATEACDGTDSDCDGSIVDEFADTDSDGVPDCVDFDGDGDGADASVDCDDDDPLVYPGAPELCDGEDTDCDGSIVDEDLDSDGDLQPDCIDIDDDSDGDPDTSDCEPLNPSIYNGAIEACDGLDSDCDGDLVDGYANFDGDTEPDCFDADDDGDGDPDATDCDDLDDDVFAGATEFCDLTDSDCDGSLVDEYADTDGDDLPDCVDEDDDGDGYFDADDCDPADGAIFPGADEVCDDVDDDCDGDVVEGFPDTDGDGVPDCADPDADGDGFDAATDDCDDADPDVHPGAEEVCNGLDDDCDPLTDEVDDDIDGFAECAGDCDDADPAVFPGAPELCDERDNDCDGATEQPGEVDFVNFFEDADGDLYGDLAAPHPDNPSCEPPDGYVSNAVDCDDGDADVNPAADEICSDGIDNDCDGEDRACSDDDLPVDDLPVGCVVTCDQTDAGPAGTPLALVLLLLLGLPRRGRPPSAVPPRRFPARPQPHTPPSSPRRGGPRP